MRDSSTDTATGTTTASDPAPETLDPVADGDLDELQARVDALSSELNRLRAHYQRVVDTVPSGIFIVDTDGLIVEMNSQGAATLGRTEAEVVHRRVSDFVAP